MQWTIRKCIPQALEMSDIFQIALTNYFTYTVFDKRQYQQNCYYQDLETSFQQKTPATGISNLPESGRNPKTK